MDDDITRAYTPQELKDAGSGFPTRGLYCFKCKTYVPQFSALDGEELESMRLLATHNAVEAMHAIERITGCPPRWAKIWALHAGTPIFTSPGPWGPPCPQCGKPLHTERSRQCPHCLASWRQ